MELRQGVEILGAAGGGLRPDDVGQRRDLDLDPANVENRRADVEVLLPAGARRRDVQVKLTLGGDEVEHGHPDHRLPRGRKHQAPGTPTLLILAWSSRSAAANRSRLSDIVAAPRRRRPGGAPTRVARPRTHPRRRTAPGGAAGPRAAPKRRAACPLNITPVYSAISLTATAVPVELLQHDLEL